MYQPPFLNIMGGGIPHPLYLEKEVDTWHLEHVHSHTME